MTVNTLNRQQLTKLAEQAAFLAEWTTVRDFATQVYGEGKAVKVVIETYGEYDDEGGTDYCIESITAYDKDGNTLAFDHSLPFFSTEAWKDVAEAYGRPEESDEEDEDEDESDDLMQFKEMSLSDEEKQSSGWIDIDELPCDEDGGTYDLTAPPALSLPV